MYIAEPWLKQSQPMPSLLVNCDPFTSKSKSKKPKIHCVKTSMSVGASRDTATTREIVAARRQLDNHMTECTQRYGYDPDAGFKLGQMSLALASENGATASIAESKSS
jgi:hypothetical protein